MDEQAVTGTDRPHPNARTLRRNLSLHHLDGCVPVGQRQVFLSWPVRGREQPRVLVRTWHGQQRCIVGPHVAERDPQRGNMRTLETVPNRIVVPRRRGLDAPARLFAEPQVVPQLDGRHPEHRGDQIRRGRLHRPSTDIGVVGCGIT